jgi:uncharacterized protein
MGDRAAAALPFPLSVAPVRDWVLALILAGQAFFMVVGVLAATAFSLFQGLAHDPGFALIAAVIALARFIIVVPVCFIWWGRLRARDIGLDWAQVPWGLAATIAVWGVAQAGAAGVALAMGQPVAVDASWMAKGIAWTLLEIVAHLAVVVLLEETVYRGFLFPQLSLWVKRKAAFAVVPSVLVGLVASQGLFALAHLPLLPMAERSNMAPAAIGMIFVISLAIATIYTMSRNLFLAMGIHLLINLPTSLVATEPYTARLLVLCAGLVVAGFIGSLRDEAETPSGG